MTLNTPDTCGGKENRSHVPQLTLASPPCAIPAPIRPPMRPCVEDEGRPPHHVRRFHAVAAVITEKMTRTIPGPLSLTIRPDIVSATALPPRIAPIKLKKATKTIPCRGVADREAMKVAAIVLASWKPFVKQKAKDIIIVRITTSYMLDFSYIFPDGVLSLYNDPYPGPDYATRSPIRPCLFARES